MSAWFSESRQQSYFEASQNDRSHWPSGLSLLKKRSPQPYVLISNVFDRPLNTEEYPRYSAARPLEMRHFASSGLSVFNTSLGDQVAIAIDTNGVVYTAGDQGRTSNDPDRVGNALGTGPEFAEVSNAQIRRSKKQLRNFRRVAFPPHLRSARFVKCAARTLGDIFTDRYPSASYLLSDDGKIWAAGYPNICGLDDLSAFDDYPTGAIPYFTPRRNVPYYTPYNTTVEEQDMSFSDMSMSRTYFLLVTSTGKLITRQELSYASAGDLFLKRKWIEQAGFVDSVQVVNGGSGYGRDYQVSITVSPPSHPNGITATVWPEIINGTIASVRILESGWGYTSPPTLTITGTHASGAPDAVLQAHLFSGSWSKVFASAYETAVAITSQGTLYVWGWQVLSNEKGTFYGTEQGRTSQSPVKVFGQYGGGYVDATSHRFSSGVHILAVRTDGKVDYSGINPVTGALADMSFSTATIPGHFIVGCASDLYDCFLLTSEGIVLRYGKDLPLDPMPTAARFSKLFSAEQGVCANRVEQLDQFGNRTSSLPILRDEYF